MDARGRGGSRQQARAFERQIARRVGLRYLLHLPPGYDTAGETRRPLILFLHGAGERGHDLEAIKRHGIPRVVEERDDFPFIAASPQCPPGERWDTDVLTALLDEIEREQAIDPDRIYVTGLSMGGFGTWALAIATPERFAAVAPICGGGEPFAAPLIAAARLPVWAFHGARDDVVPPRRTTEMVEALQRAGGDVRLTVYPEAGHDSWTPTYANPELYAWFLARSRAGRVPASAS